MERLTYRLEDQYGNPTDSIILESDLIFLNSSEKWKKVLSRLAAYEDTGLEPEEIISAVDMAKVACALEELNAYKELGSLDRLRELAQADWEGRCVVLPAPLGNTVYRIEYVEQCQGRYEIGICKHRFDILFYAMECRNFGKTVFLTREEAEAALATDC